MPGKRDCKSDTAGAARWPAADYGRGRLFSYRYAAGCRPFAETANFTAVLTANLLELAGIEDESTRRFTLLGRYDFYLNAQERKQLTGVPKCWKSGRPFLKPEILREYGFSYPLLYDVVGLHALYCLNDPGINRKIDAVIGYISTNAFHHAIADGYGILAEDKGVYHAMGWDPKYPGWFDAAAYLEHGGAPRLLFYALHASRYPAARKTKWFTDVLRCLDGYRTDDGRHTFPAA